MQKGQLLRSAEMQSRHLRFQLLRHEVLRVERRGKDLFKEHAMCFGACFYW